MNARASSEALKGLFAERGFSVLKAQIWAEFLQYVLQIYWEAAAELLQPANWAEFKNKLGALGKPKKVAGSTLVQVPIEDAITSEIGHRAQLIRQKLPSNHFLRKHDVKLEFEALLPSLERAGRHSKKADFRAISQYPNAPEIAIEAKPLTAKSDIPSKYLAADGMGCFFASDSAYTTGPIGAMLAYSMTIDGTSMRGAISKALSAYEPKPTRLHKVTITSPGVVDCSQHDRAQWGLQPITILHLELQFPLEIPNVDNRIEDLATDSR